MRKYRLHSLSFFTRFNSSLGIDLKSILSTRCPYLLRSIDGGAGVLGLEGVRSFMAADAFAAIVEAQVVGALLLVAVPFELDGVLLTGYAPAFPG